MDDILIWSNSISEHRQTLEKLFKRFSFHGLEISMKKCQFLKQEVDYLGFTLTPEGMKKQQKLLKPMMDIEVPKTLTEARSLCSLFSFYRRFIKNYSMIAHPLTNLTKGHPIGKGKGVKVEANAECEEALKQLKEELMRDVCLKYPDFSKADFPCINSELNSTS